MTAAPPPFLTEARDLSDDEHHGLKRRRDELQHAPGINRTELMWWEKEMGWHDDPADYFEANRPRFLEAARIMFEEDAT